MSKNKSHLTYCATSAIKDVFFENMHLLGTLVLLTCLLIIIMCYCSKIKFNNVLRKKLSINKHN